MAHPDHTKNRHALRRIEGQIKGIQKMVEERRYCVDILTQISAVRAALARVQDNILEAHLTHCVQAALQGKSESDRQKKIIEIFGLLKRFRKTG